MNVPRVPPRSSPGEISRHLNFFAKQNHPIIQLRILLVIYVPFNADTLEHPPNRISFDEPIEWAPCQNTMGSTIGIYLLHMYATLN